MTAPLGAVPIFGHRGDDGLQGVVARAHVDGALGRVAGEGVAAAHDHVAAQTSDGGKPQATWRWDPSFGGHDSHDWHCGITSLWPRSCA